MNNIDYILIGKRIKAARKALGMTQEKLAEELDVSIGYISQVERGVTKISLDLLGALSSILKRCQRDSDRVGVSFFILLFLISFM